MLFLFPSLRNRNWGSETVNNLTKTNRIQIQTLCRSICLQSSGSGPSHHVLPKYLFTDLSGSKSTTFLTDPKLNSQLFMILSICKGTAGARLHFPHFHLCFYSSLRDMHCLPFPHSCCWVTSVSVKESIDIYNTLVLVSTLRIFTESNISSGKWRLSLDS